MKMSLYLALCVLLFLPFTGCGDTSQQPAKTFEMPVAASPPDTMTTDEILYIVNELLGYEDESKKRFKREDAEVYKVPASTEGTETETLYLFLVGDLEIGLFASSEKDCVVSAYVRMLFDYTMVKAHMMSFAGVFLAALEPNEYENMLSSVVSAGEEKLDESKTASGEFWRILYSGSLTNIVPRKP